VEMSIFCTTPQFLTPIEKLQKAGCLPSGSGKEESFLCFCGPQCIISLLPSYV